jgi:hypothetical protein
MKELKIEIPKGYEIDTENSTFEKIIFKPLENTYPKTWKACIRLLKAKNTFFGFINTDSEISVTTYPHIINKNFNLLPSKEIAKKFLILQKLYTCRQAYIGNWEPDWTDFNTPKYIIKASENKLIIHTYYSDNRSFSFPTLKIAKEFLNNFESDLEYVKDLL